MVESFKYFSCKNFPNRNAFKKSQLNKNFSISNKYLLWVPCGAFPNYFKGFRNPTIISFKYLLTHCSIC